MLKKFSVLILAAVQILFCIGLSAVEPAKEWLIENNGTVYNLKVSSVSYSNDIDWATDFTCCVECDWSNISDYEHFPVLKGEYGIIETDENGISHLSSRTDRKPKNENCIKGPFSARHLGWYVDVVPTEEVRKKLNELGIYPHYGYSIYQQYEGTHDITYNVRVYKGLYRIEGLSVDGVPIEEVIA